MAQIALMDANEEIASKGYVSICDCACGAGAMLIAGANVLRANKINYQRQALFVAQDIDRIDVCKAVEEYGMKQRNEGVREGIAKSIMRVIKQGKLSYDEIAEGFDVSINEVRKLAAQMN